MPDVKITIKTGVERTSPDEVEEQEKLEKKKMAKVSLLAHQTLANSKQVLNYSINNYGDFTGDYATQKRLQFGASVLGDVATIGVGVATNPIGAVVAFAGVALNRTLQVVSHFQDVRHKEIESEFLRKRSGNSLTGNSRETEN